MPVFFRQFFAVLCLLASMAATSRESLAQAPAESPPPTAPQPTAPGGEARPSEEQPKTSPSGAQSEIPAVVIDGSAAVALLGKPVQSLKGEDLGRVVDVIVDRNGMMRAAIIDFGGFLGVGTRKIAVDWRALHFPEKGGLGKLIAELPRDQLRMAPVFKEGEPVVVIGGPAPTPPAAGTPAAPPPPEATAPAQKP